MRHSKDFKRIFASLPAIVLSLLFVSPLMAHEGEEHGINDAHHGGLVMMANDLHFEVVMQPEGGLRLYYTDIARAELPAAVVSDVAVEIERSGKTIEPVSMSISAGGDFWEGASGMVSSPETIVRVAFVFQNEPLVIDIPASFIPAPVQAKAATEHQGH